MVPALVRAEQGFTLIEVLIAMALMAVGISATLGVFGSSGRATVISQQIDIATQQAQAEVDRLSQVDYSKLGLTSTPSTSTNPLNPNYRVSGTTLSIKTGLTESFVLSSDSGQSAASVNPTPTTFAAGTGDGTVTGKHLPIRHVARRELPHRALRRDTQHQAHHGRRDGRRQRNAAGPRARLDLDRSCPTRARCRREAPRRPHPGPARK